MVREVGIMGRQTQGDYRFSNKIQGSKRRLNELLNSKEAKILEKYEGAMVLDCLVDATKAKNFDTILGLTRLLPKNKSWLELDKDDIGNLVVQIMNKYSDDGKENSVTSDFKRFLKIWFRFVKLGSRSFKKVGDPDETRDIVSKNVPTKVTRLQLITPEEKKKLVDSCTTLRDKALIDLHYDAGTRIGELLSLKIRHLKIVKHGALVTVDGKTGERTIQVLECLPTLASWLESHPDKDNPESYLFCSMKSVWTGNKLSYSASVRMLKRSCDRAGIRPLYWHLFRHTEATRSAKTLPESLLKVRHGWSATSKMSARYSHVTSEDANRAYLKAHGIEAEEDSEEDTTPILCPICKIPNSFDSTICQKCAKPLTTDKAILLESKESDDMESLKKQVAEMSKLLVAVMGNEAFQKNAEIQKLWKDNSRITMG